MKEKAANIINGLFILLFTYTALSKLIAFKKFEWVLRQTPLVRSYATEVAVIIPVVELIIAALLFIPATSVKGMIAAIMLLLLFSNYIAFMIATQSNLPCSCGGVVQQLSWRQHIVFNIFFIVLGITRLYVQKGKKIGKPV